MKQIKQKKQQCRAWRTSSSLYLKLFMLLAVFVGSVGSAWADEEVWSIDFVQLAKNSSAADKTACVATGTTFNVGSTPVDVFTNSGMTLPTSNLGVQGATNWLLRKTTSANGFQNNNSGSRWFGIKECKKGQKIRFDGSADSMNNLSTTSDEKEYIVNADGVVGFSVPRYGFVNSVSLINPTYTLTYNGNTGTSAKTSDDFVLTKSVTLPSASKDGWEFVGWYTEATGGTLVGAAGASYTPQGGNVTLYAHYRQLISHNITNVSGSGGTVTVPATAYEADVVTVKHVPVDGKVLDKIVVTNKTTGETVAMKGYTFVMPAADVEVNVVFKDGNKIGNNDCSAYVEDGTDIAIYNNANVTIKFVNHTNTNDTWNNWYNWFLNLYSGSNRVMGLRPDNWDDYCMNGSCPGNGSDAASHQTGITLSDYDWGNFKTFMQGSNVTINIVKKGNHITIKATMTNNGQTWTETLDRTNDMYNGNLVLKMATNYGYLADVQTSSIAWSETNDKTYTVFGTGALNEHVVTSVPYMTMTYGDGTQSVNVTNESHATSGGVSGTTITNGVGNSYVQFVPSSGKVDVADYEHQIPLHGTFYTFEPCVSGQLHIDGYFSAGDASVKNRAWLVDATNGMSVDAAVYMPTESGMYHVDKDVFVMAGHRYFLFSPAYAEGQLDNRYGYPVAASAWTKFALHSFTFTPTSGFKSSWDLKNTTYTGTPSGWNNTNTGYATAPSTASAATDVASGTAGLKFSNTRLYRNTNEGAMFNTGGYIEIDVTPGDVVAFKNIRGNNTNCNFQIEDGSEIEYYTAQKNVRASYSVVAKSDKIIIKATKGYMFLDEIVISPTLKFAQGDEVIVKKGDSAWNYWGQSLANYAGSTAISTKSSDNNVAEPLDGVGSAVKIKDVGTVLITRELQTSASHNPANATIIGQYILHVVNEDMTVQDEEVVLPESGILSYTQAAQNAPEYAHITYAIVPADQDGLGSVKRASATLDQEDDSNEYNLTVKSTGKVKVSATCGNVTVYYVLTVVGVSFVNNYEVVPNGTSSYQTYLADGLAPTQCVWEIVEAETTETFRSSTVDDNGLITIVANAVGTEGSESYKPSTQGGIIVVRASKTEGGKTSSATCCVTVAGDKCYYDFYRDPLTMGSIVENLNPGTAWYVMPNDGDCCRFHYNAKHVGKLGEGFITDADVLYAQENWYNAQTTGDWPTIHKYWKFIYKTDQRDSKLVRYHTNEPLFAFRQQVNGENGRIVKETAGLIVNAMTDYFGVSNNTLGNDFICSACMDGQAEKLNDPGQAREMDRCILFRVGAKLTVPLVKPGRFVRIHWYRHSDNNGDKFKIKNGMDLDGKPINPDDILRFTGSHYYPARWTERDETGIYAYKGSAIVYVPTKAELEAKAGDYPYATDLKNNYVTINGQDYVDLTFEIADNGWTEFYRVEIMEKYMTEQKVCQVDCYEETGTQGGTAYTHRATTDGYNGRDLNLPDMYNKTDHNQVAANLVSRIKTHDLGGDLIKKAPSLYINGYAGNCFTWNGWQNIKLDATPDASSTATCQTGREDVAVGQRITYAMQKVYDISGTGAVKLTLNTLSGNYGAGEAEYCLNKQETWVAFGEYSVQEYPYTWDFREYNMDRNNKHLMNNSVLTEINPSNHMQNRYGSWNSNNVPEGVNAIYGHQIAEPQSATITNTSYPYIGAAAFPLYVRNGSSSDLYGIDDTRNKRFFAQGSQLTINDGTNHTLLETEGLRINLAKVDDTLDGQIYFSGNSVSGTNNSSQWGDKTNQWENTSLTVNGSITIPEVPKGMYVFVKADKEPSVSGAVKLPAETAKVADYNITTVGWKADIVNGNYAEVDGVLKVSNTAVRTNNYDFQYLVREGIPTEAGRSYKVTYTIKASAPTHIESRLGTWSVNGSTKGFDVTSVDWQDIVVTYDNAATNSFILLQHGSVISDVYIKKIVVEEVVGDLILKEQDTFTPTAASVTLLPTELNEGTWVYKVTNEGVSDVVITPQADTKIEALGVTKEFKMMTNGEGWATESRRMRVDYNESSTFTKHKLKTYFAKTSATVGGNSVPNPVIDTKDEHKDEGKLYIMNAQVVRGINWDCTPEEHSVHTDQNEVAGTKRGLIMEDEAITVDKNSALNKRSMIPLFVPACNIPYTEITGNVIQDHYDEGTVSASGGGTYRYVFTNQYYKWENGIAPTPGTEGNMGTIIPAQYSYYIVRQAGTLRKNSSYLEINSANGESHAAKQFYIFYGEPGNDDYALGIEGISEDTDVIDSPENLNIYTLNGVKLNGIPTQRGVYIINGKKVLVK